MLSAGLVSAFSDCWKAEESSPCSADGSADSDLCAAEENARSRALTERWTTTRYVGDNTDLETWFGPHVVLGT